MRHRDQREARPIDRRYQLFPCVTRARAPRWRILLSLGSTRRSYRSSRGPWLTAPRLSGSLLRARPFLFSSTRVILRPCACQLNVLSLSGLWCGSGIMGGRQATGSIGGMSMKNLSLVTVCIEVQYKISLLTCAQLTFQNSALILVRQTQASASVPFSARLRQ
jgi:hypothetical protein